MESSRAKIAGPVIAAGAVSLGLVLIGACGLGKHDTYVAPPPIKSANEAVPAVRYGTTTASAAPKVFIPPSPSWQVAPAGPPRKAVGFTVPPTSESTTRGPRTSTPSVTPAAVPPPAFTTEFELPPATQPRPTTVDQPSEEQPTTTRRVPTATAPGLSDDE
ncbi:hypothetical protein [Nocardia sp. CA-135398]|uniref:hypothetical protein n=1 Tax=Nocardia sp. CA-135398 TaxID=3239977 RepID=UPI003D957861